MLRQRRIEASTWFRLSSATMNFGFTDEQELLRAEVRKFLDQNAPLAEVRKIVAAPDGFDRHLWARMAELGWIGLTVPDQYGGVGLDLVTLVVLLEETGRTLFPSPMISSVLAAKAIERHRRGLDEDPSPADFAGRHLLLEFWGHW